MVEPVCFQLVYLVTYIIIFFTGKFSPTNLVRKTNERRTTTLSQTPTVSDQRPNARSYRGPRNDDDKLLKNKNVTTPRIHQRILSFHAGEYYRFYSGRIVPHLPHSPYRPVIFTSSSCRSCLLLVLFILRLPRLSCALLVGL